MSEHFSTVSWNRADAPFRGGRYSRAHVWRFDGGCVVSASASPHVVPAPWSDAAAVDPEEAFVAALSSCHMLWFLSLAAAQGFVVDSYEDDAIGRMGDIGEKRMAITDVILRPRVAFDPAHAADRAQVDALHHAAHSRCFLANSVKSSVRVEAPQ
jgi:organic hydroperoxide reductase OsmC/OhrA